MNRLSELMAKKGEKLLSVYFTAGFPHLDSTEEIILALERGGVDMAEVGIPFSDPMADGPVIQESSSIALKNGMSLKCLFSQLTNIRKKSNMPLIMMGYLNPIYQYGVENFCKSCQEVGIDGVIIPDLPFAEYIEKGYKALGEKYNLHFIMLITPETSEERIRLIDENTSGFIYIVSSASITGTRNSFSPESVAYFERIRGMHLKNPTLIGFGISNRATLESAQGNANGAIIGSAFIKKLSQYDTPATAVTALLSDLAK